MERPCARGAEGAPAGSNTCRSTHWPSVVCCRRSCAPRERERRRRCGDDEVDARRRAGPLAGAAADAPAPARPELAAGCLDGVPPVRRSRGAGREHRSTTASWYLVRSANPHPIRGYDDQPRWHDGNTDRISRATARAACVRLPARGVAGRDAVLRRAQPAAAAVCTGAAPDAGWRRGAECLVRDRIRLGRSAGGRDGRRSRAAPGVDRRSMLSWAFHARRSRSRGPRSRSTRPARSVAPARRRCGPAQSHGWCPWAPRRTGGG